MKTLIRTWGLSLLWFAAIQMPSLAGGSSWNVRIEKIQLQSASRATLVLQALEDKVFDRQCPQFLIEVDYQPDYLRGREELAAEREQAARKTHEAALASLQTAYNQHSTLRFGEMMGGLVQKQPRSWLDSLLLYFQPLFGKADPPSIAASIPTECQFTAPGLALFDDSASKQVVYVINEL